MPALGPGVPPSRRHPAVKEQLAGGTEDKHFARRPGSEDAVLLPSRILLRREAGNPAHLVPDRSVPPRLIDTVRIKDDGVGGDRLVGPLQNRTTARSGWHGCTGSGDARISGA